MKFALIAFAMLSMASASETKEHPIAKIISMIEELKVKARTQGEEEAAAYQKFEYFCKTTIKELNTAITKEKEQIEILEDTIESKTKEIEKLKVDIEALEKQIEENEAASAKAKKIREEEEETYKEADADFGETIEAIQTCIDSLESTKADTDSLLAQKSVTKVLNLASMLVSEEERTVLTSFLQQPKKPKAKVYSFKSQGVIELLKKLMEKFEKDKLAATKAETNSLNSYNLAKQAREEALEAAQKSKDEKEDIKGQAEEDLAAAEKDLADTKKDLAANEESLEKTTADCQTKADEWATRSEARENEIKAMDMAIKILAKVGGVRAPKSEELVQQAASFLQIEDPKAKAVKILIAEAQKTHSKALRRLAQQITAHLTGPFDDINQMIQKMIFRLMAEQKDEDDHKNWCDMELEKSTESKEDKEDKKEELENKIAEATATIQELTEEVTTLTDEISEIVASIKEATETRNTDKAENAATIKDAKDAQEALANAIAVLDEFYKSQGAFLQTGSNEPVEVEQSPDTWDSESNGLQEPTEILDMMKTISADFATMEAETAAQEEEDQKKYDEFITAESVNKAEKEQLITDKTRKKESLIGKKETWTGKLKHVVSELEAVVQYLKDLVPACGKAEEGEQNQADYEARKQARTDEIEALRKAQTILEEAFKEKLFLQKKASIRKH